MDAINYLFIPKTMNDAGNHQEGHEVNTSIVAHLFDYAQKHGFENDLESRINEAISPHERVCFPDTLDDAVPLTRETVTKHSCAMSNALYVQIMSLFDEVSLGSAYDCGKEFVRKVPNIKKRMAVLRTIKPELALSILSYESKELSSVIDISTQVINKNEWKIRYQYAESISQTGEGDIRTPATCDWNRGLIASYLDMLGARQVTVEETACVSRGDPYCEFDVYWKKKSLGKRFESLLYSSIKHLLYSVLEEDTIMGFEKTVEERNKAIYTLEKEVQERTRELVKSKLEYENKNVQLEQVNAELEEMLTKLEHQSYYDGLTDIPNRRYYDEYVNREWKTRMRASDEHHSFALIIGDIDHFKKYNDTYGHSEGDDCLVSVAQALNDSLRGSDFIARYGGEEFVIVLPTIEKRYISRVGSRILQTVSDLQIPHSASDTSSYVTISLGCVYTSDFTNSTPDRLLEKADDALYESKKNGRNRFTAYEY
jgi:diguanylate cyclase (GGDEF)-like protein